jgi:hypothetical protein
MAKIGRGSQMGAWHQDGLADWLSVVMWLWLWQNVIMSQTETCNSKFGISSLMAVREVRSLSQSVDSVASLLGSCTSSAMTDRQSGNLSSTKCDNLIFGMVLWKQNLLTCALAAAVSIEMLSVWSYAIRETTVSLPETVLKTVFRKISQ